ncbi:Gfo/Idh/MocA family oxidoreductase [Lutimonas saemankumensis]|uniref:Gfo/Idh/MocA family protein n=1 Tax=Lutimonas saemankumensis TaxID=483016 RepID=UPI001CD53D8B|nr:Gfo/Idh/MocA family oxidoreductase [Lutimonas saemankumensis]MCA0930824.1 Gfo/Idh/MocA family oxidoreductase [Lutimonas saemankumensis]
MGKTYNWAILGCGKIARKFVNDLKLLKNANLYAAASRSIENAENFAEELGFEKAYGSYLEMVKDPEVDVVYIATPHAMHMEHSILCLEHKKAVLCEKAFAMNVKEVDQMITASKDNDTFLMEAFWTIFQPKFNKVLELAKDPELGRLKFIKSDFMFNADFDPDKRLYNIDLGAGSLLDIGIYPIFRSMMFLGKPEKIKTMANIRETGVEDSICMLFDYEGGEKAVLTSSFESSSINETELCFEHGFIKFERDPAYPIIFGKNGKREEIGFELSRGEGYELEAAHVMECMDQGITESPVLTFQFSRDLMEIMDRVRKEAGIVFPKHDLT